MKYLYPNQIILLHEKILEEFGGSAGVRDKGLLESAVYRPQATFGGQDLYPDLFSKAAALGHSLIRNHPFVDGNKRTGFEAMRLMLRLNYFDIAVTTDEKFRFVLGIAKGRISEHEIADWLKQNSKPYKKTE